MRIVSYLIAVALSLALTLGPAPARAETTSCTPIPAVPTTISVQGIYCFTQHLNTSIATGFAIEIATNNVVLDLNGFKLGGLAAGPGTQAVGIAADNRQNITIKNGTVRGFQIGIGLGGDSHVIEDIRADQNTLVGIQVAGRDTLIRNNQVIATGGTTAFPNPNALGIAAFGSGPRVLDNDVIDTQALGTGEARGIYFGGAAGALAVNNRITNAHVGILYDASDGKYRDNLTTGVTTPFSGGTNAGNNN